MANNLLSKTKYMNGLQCLKYLWFVCNEPEKVAAPDALTRRIFDQGHLVGELARKLFPGGIEVPRDNFMESIKLTRELIKRRRPLFEAGLMAEGLYSRLDILNPTGRDEWDIIEVKSSTGVKEENFHDVSFQRLCAGRLGLTINKCYLAHLNNRYVKDGEIDPARLFAIEDITEQVAEARRGIEDRIALMLETIKAPECPGTPVGSHCSGPYACPVAICWEELPENNIFTLYRGGKKCFELFNSGVLNLRDIPEDYKLNRSQLIQKLCDHNGLPHIDKGPIGDFLKSLHYPQYYMDFETFNPAIPLFDGTRPYQRIPFQFSVHVSGENGDLEHLSFLADGPQDPRPEFLHELKKAIGPQGTLVTYNQPFEESVLNELAEAFPQYGDWIAGIRARLSDLLTPFRSFHYYHPQQEGSASIKSVLPALTGKSYDGMAIAAGEDASAAYLDMTYGELTAEEKRQIRSGLEKYCGLDSEGMVWIVEKLRELSEA